MKWEGVLLQACVMLGGERYYSQYLDDHLWGFPDGTEVVEGSNALPAYVAELLRVKCCPDGLAPVYENHLHSMGYRAAMAKPTARILAAMVALGHLTIEQAREVT